MMDKMLRRSLAVLLSFSLICGLMLISAVSVFADTHYDTTADVPERPKSEVVPGEAGNGKFIKEGESLDTVSADTNISYNFGTITDNNGTVGENFASLDKNYDEVGINEENATIGENTNTGFILHNAGVVTENNGQIENNFGTVVTNNAEVTNNYDNATVQNGSRPLHQYWSVTLSGLNNGSAVFDNEGDGFLYQHVTGKNYLQDGAGATNDHKSGRITIRAAEGFMLTQRSGGAAPATCRYEITRSGDDYIVTITSLSGTTALTLDQLNLVLEAILQESEETFSNGVNNASVENSQATGNLISAAKIKALIETALAADPTATVLNIDLGNDPSLTADTIVALCEKNDVAKRCHFTHNGMKFVLFIPVVDPTSATYQQCKALLDAEPGKQAGPIRLSQLFAPVGFSLSGE